MEEETHQIENTKLSEFLATTDLTELASIQSVVTGVVKIIENPSANAKDLKEVIEVDPPLTAKVLRFANSAVLGVRRKITEIDQAVIWIGFDALKELTLNQKVCEAFQDDVDYNGYTKSKLWKHSVAVALLSKMIYRREFGDRGENVYAAALMHDIGIIVEDQFRPEEFRQVIDLAVDKKIALVQAEKEVFGFDHGELGQEIISLWGLSPDMISAVGMHHNLIGVHAGNKRMSLTLYIANYLVKQHKIGFVDRYSQDRDRFYECLDELGLNIFSIKLIVQAMKKELDEMRRWGLF